MLEFLPLYNELKHTVRHTLDAVHLVNNIIQLAFYLNSEITADVCKL